MDKDKIRTVLSVVNAPRLRKKKPDCVVTEEQVGNICEAYNAGCSLRGLVDRFHLRFEKIKLILDLAGAPIRPKGVSIRLTKAINGSSITAGAKRRKLNTSQRSDLCNAYKSGASWSELEARFGMCESSLRRIVKKSGVWRPPGHYLHTVNDAYFRKIDTPEKAYFFGLLMADGTVFHTRNNKRLGGFRINLESGDSHILEELKQAIGSNRKMRKLSPKIAGRKDQVLLAVHSQQIAEDLVSHGCVPRKSYHAKYPHHLSENLHRHFIRGYFDGDGCVSTYQRPSRIDLTCNFVGTEDIVMGIAQKLHIDAGVNLTKIHQRQGCCCVSYGGNRQIVKIHRYLYSEHGPALVRKKDKWETALVNLKDQKIKYLESLAPDIDPGHAALCYKTMSTPQIAAKFKTNIYKVRKALRLADVKLRSREDALELRYGAE